MTTVAYYDAETVRGVLHMRDLIPAMEDALKAFSAGEVVQPVRNMIPVERAKGFFGIMPAVGQAAMGTKLVTFYPENTAKGIESHHAIIALFDSATGIPLALMDGTLITEMRTAAVSAAATKALALPDPKVLAILGSGVQARSHIAALREVYAFDEVRVWSRSPENAGQFAADHGATAVAGAAEAVADADVVVTATSASAPVLRGAWLKPGAHVNAVGAPLPDWRELDDAVMAHTVIADSREAARTESGDVILSGAAIAGEIGEVLAGTVTVDRHQTTVFKSLGLAVEDVATASLVHAKLQA